MLVVLANLACGYEYTQAMRDQNGCSGHVTLPVGVTSIGYDAFYGCYDLTNMTIPQSVTSIGDNAFNGGCTSLTNMVIPEGVTSIGASAFYGCPLKVVLKGAVHSWPCSGHVTLPVGVTSIGRSAFQGCTSLTNMTISEGDLDRSKCVL
jgi:hypothetical protein